MKIFVLKGVDTFVGAVLYFYLRPLRGLEVKRNKFRLDSGTCEV